MSRQQFFSKNLAEKAVNMLGEDSDNSESDDKSSEADVEEADLEEINSISSDQEMSSFEDLQIKMINLMILLPPKNTLRETERYGLRCYLAEQSKQVLQI